MIISFTWCSTGNVAASRNINVKIQEAKLSRQPFKTSINKDVEEAWLPMLVLFLLALYLSADSPGQCFDWLAKDYPIFREPIKTLSSTVKKTLLPLNFFGISFKQYSVSLLYIWLWVLFPLCTFFLITFLYCRVLNELNK